MKTNSYNVVTSTGVVEVTRKVYAEGCFEAIWAASRLAHPDEKFVQVSRAEKAKS